MPKLAEYPIGLQPYIYHGVDVDEKGTEAIGDCPFCTDGKFSINIERGVWKCWNCNEGSDKGGGNIYTFLAKLYEMGRGKKIKRIQELAKEKGILNYETLIDWGVFVHPLLDELALVGYNKDHKIVNIYRWLEDLETQKYRWMPTRKDQTNTEHTELSPTLLGCHLFDESKENIFLCEGLFDAITLYETLGFTQKVIKSEDEQEFDLNYVKDPLDSYLQDCNILAIPSASMFNERWVDYFSDKNVYLLPHNDYPKTLEGGKVLDPAGYKGMRKVAGEICSDDKPPKKVEYLSWHPAGETYDPSRKKGYDIRDLLNEKVGDDGVVYEKRIENLAEMMLLCKDIPASWSKIEKSDFQLEGMSATKCESWEELVIFWKDALYFTEGLDRGLSVALACIASTNSKGDQIWVKLISAPGTGKTTLCRGLAVSRKYVLEGSIITGFHSGWRKKGEDGEIEDFSLISKMRNKTFVMKDGDTLLKMPNRDQILSQARDLYDGETTSHFRSQDTKEEKGHRTTIIICGTDSLRELDSSELGERYIDCVLMREITPELKRNILLSAINNAISNSKQMVNGKLEGHYNERMAKALKSTGGYVNYLRRNAEELVATIEFESKYREECLDLAEFTAYMRARPSKKQDEGKTIELPTRLVSQLSRLALYLAVVLNKKEVDQEVMRRVRQCALDTSEGKTLQLCVYLYKMGTKGETSNILAYKANHDKTKIYSYLLFLRGIGVVEHYNPTKNGVKEEMRWRLVPNVYNLYKRVMIK